LRIKLLPDAQSTTSPLKLSPGGDYACQQYPCSRG